MYGCAGCIGCCTHFQYLVETKDKRKEKKEEKKGLHRGILKTGVLHKEFCAQSLEENLKLGNKRKNNRSLHRDAFLRMCAWMCGEGLGVTVRSCMGVWMWRVLCVWGEV